MLVRLDGFSHLRPRDNHAECQGPKRRTDEHHISEGRGSSVTPRASSSVVEPESDNQSDVVSDDKSAEDQESDGTMTKGIYP
jgi:hypothetical protein